MIRLAVVIMLLLLYQDATTQELRRECSKRTRKTAGRTVDSILLQKRMRELRVTATTPYIVRLYVVIFASNDGSIVAASQADVRRQIANMAAFYAPHNICFVLGGVDQVNNSDMNGHDADNEEGELEPYLRAGHITIFVHENLFDEDGSLNGNAYDIPNTYLSIVGSAIASNNNTSTLAHEMGHCFGLYHTFEDAFGEENRARSGSCSDCEDDGDYLCDTQADRETPAVLINASTCAYTGSATDECGSTLLMETQNIMTYGRRECRDHFSNGQGARARDFIITDSDLSATLAPDNLTLQFAITYTSGDHSFTARNNVTFDASTIIATQSAQVNAAAYNIVVKPGTQFKPTVQAGFVVLRVNTFCQ